MKLTIQADAKGNLAGAAAPFDPTLDEITFVNKPAARLSNPDYLKKAAGAYQLQGQTVTVGMKDDGLTLVLPGRLVDDLVPELGGEYSFKQLKVVAVKLIEDAKGDVTGLEIYQPSGVIEAKRAKG